MSGSSYILLTTSDSGSSHKFAVLYGGRQRAIRKVSNVEPTVEGGQEITMGGIHEQHAYTIRVRHTEDRSGYGDMAALEYYYRLNNPNGSPSNIITMVDHFGTSHNVVLVGDFMDQLLGVAIMGSEAWSLVLLSILYL